MSMQSLLTPKRTKGRWVSLDNFLYLICLYATILIGFGLIYIILDLNGHVVLIDETSFGGNNFLDRLASGFYFSAVTLFSLGYGDITPIGIGRMIAVAEALIGYVIPTAFVARVVFNIENKKEV
ncbi:potassium channel family protein [Cytobacillus purgationiresistens]|nr:potassium channel family protein [Cytobacillus purgationiresistens]